MQPVYKKMTSKERHELRYQRRKLKRENKAKIKRQQYTNINNIFSFHPMLQSYKKCKKNVMWKASSQKFIEDLCTSAKKESKKLLDGTWKSAGFYEFDIIQRGKPRHIKSVNFAEKGVQRSLCDNCLIPILQSCLIYDNGATLPGKGTQFALERFKQHLRHHYRLYGRQGGIYFFDFSNYFQNINNNFLLNKISKKIENEKIMNITKALIFAFGEKGLGLGSQVSQISAVFYPNSLDHYIKENQRIYGYGRYMDDGYIIHSNIEQLKKIIKKFEYKCKQLGIIMNKKKCFIKKLTSNFIFLKSRFYITPTGKIIQRLDKKGITKERKRLRKFFQYVQQKRMAYKDVFYNFHSWLCSKTDKYTYYIKLNMIYYFNKLFKLYGFYTPEKTNKRRYKILKYLAKVAKYNPI